MFKGLVKNKNFMLLTLGGFISGIGDYLYNIAITVMLYSVTKSIGSVAIMWLSRAALRIPMQYMGGVIADKCNKKITIALVNFISVFVAFMFIVVNKENVWVAYILAFLLQSLNDIDENSETAILPELVKKEEISYANSIFSTLNSVSIFLSPAISGVIYKFYGGDILFKINAISFLIAGVMFSLIKYNYEKSNKEVAKFELIKSGKEGYNILRQYIEVKNLFIIAGVYAVLGRFYETYKVAVADILLNVNADGIRYFDYAIGIGGLMVPFFIKALSKRKDTSVYLIACMVFGLELLVFGYSRSFILTFGILMLFGITSSVQGIYSRTIIQRNIPQEYIGRIFSFYKIVLTSCAIIGLLIAEPLYKLVGIGNGFLVIVIIAIVACLKQIFYKREAVEMKNMDVR